MIIKNTVIDYGLLDQKSIQNKKKAQKIVNLVQDPENIKLNLEWIIIMIIKKKRPITTQREIQVPNIVQQRIKIGM